MDGRVIQKTPPPVAPKEQNRRLALRQEAVDVKENESAAILAILARLSVKDALAANPAAAAIIRGGDCVPALKRDQPSPHGEVERDFADPSESGPRGLEGADKDHSSRSAPSRAADRSPWALPFGQSCVDR